METKLIALVLALVSIVLISGCVDDRQIDNWPIVTDFESCVAAGNPLMESYPRKCSDGVNTYTEEHCTKAGTEVTMALIDAVNIGNMMVSECATVGTLKETHVCNEDTGTYWIDLEPFRPQEGCNPACVIDLEAREADVNWRCTGLIQPFTVQDCEEAGGRTQNIVGMEAPYCLENETDLGPVEGFISPNVCCVPGEG